MQIKHLKPILENMGALKARVVHIAGSKGKGTTAHLLARLLELKGEKVGLFTSPYILDQTEMIQVNHKKISKEDLEKWHQNAPKTEPALSEFESLFLAAIHYFEAQECDTIILECGWGGARDATNAIENKALTILTHIEEEHIGFIADDLKGLVKEKLGICRNDTPLLTLTDHGVVIQNWIENESKEKDFPVVLCPEFDLGQHHASCVGLAFTAVQALGYVPNHNDLLELEALVIPGRFERIPFGSHTIILDGAHTHDSLSALEIKVQHYCYENNLPDPFWALHFLSDKDPELHKLFPRKQSFWVSLEDERAGENHGSLKEESIESLLMELRKQYMPQCLVITGSFRLVAHAKRLLKA